MDAALGAKWLALVVLGVGSFAIGFLPPFFVARRSSGRRPACSPAILSCLLCFGAGVLFGTAIVHVTAEARPVLSATESRIPLTETLMGAGLLFVYLVEEAVHFTLHRKPRRECHNNSSARHAIVPLDGAPCYGSVKICPQEEDEPSTERLVPSEERSSSAFLLLLALSIHSAIEGFAIGVESSARSVLFMLLAVALHKFVMAFCLGMEMSLPESTPTLRRAAAFLAVFSLTSVLGVFGGILLRMDEQAWGELVCSVLQALAAGALLHVALLEILPRERSRCHQIGLSQFSSVSSGFGLSLLLQYLSD